MMTKSEFGRTPGGARVNLYTLTNRSGVEARITNFGGTLVSLRVPDRNGHSEDVVLGYDSIDNYVDDKFYFGGIIGRYANRIALGQFKLGDVNYVLARNNGENNLHGGDKGFNKVVWEATDCSKDDVPALQLDYLSKDREEGFPGNLKVRVVYTLTDRNELRIDYTVTTDRETIVNLTSHPYFNLAGHGAGNILQHELTLLADKYTPTGPTLIPTGELRSVEGTPFDFRQPATIGARINQADRQLILGQGYDHNWVLNKGRQGVLELAARVYEPSSGRVLEVLTTEPGMQFYSGNHLDDGIHGKGSRAYNRRDAFCLETQHFPDSPNHSEFPSTVLKPGARYRSTTVYKFSVR